MKKSGLPVIAWVLVGLIVVAAGLITLGRQDQNADPETQSYSPSGVSAFAEMLRKSGVAVAITEDPKPKLGPDDVAVAFRIEGKPQRDGLFGATESEEDRFLKNFWNRIHDGGTGILLPLAYDYLDASRGAEEKPFVRVVSVGTGEAFNVTSAGMESGLSNYEAPAGDAVQMTVWTVGNEPFLRAIRHGRGTVLVAKDGIGVTNRFVDKYDNAKAFGSIVAMLNKGHKRIVFTEASFGKVNEPGLMETIGPWANAAWQQLIFLGLVVVFTLGKRFGVPEETRVVQRGARELLDGIADTFGRAHSSQYALAMALASADSDLRVVLKLPKDATRSERDRLIPPSLQNAMTRLQVASEHPAVTQAQALELIRRMQEELEEFLGPNRAKLRSLAKLRS